MSHQTSISFSYPHLKPCVLKIIVGQHPPILTQSTFHTTATWSFLKHKHLMPPWFLRSGWFCVVSCPTSMAGIQVPPSVHPSNRTSLSTLAHPATLISVLISFYLRPCLLPLWLCATDNCPHWGCLPHIRNSISYSSFKAQASCPWCFALTMANSPMARAPGGLRVTGIIS